jgi:hypothetical protein
MKRGVLMVIAICSSLSMTPVVADDSGENALGSAPGDVAGVAAGKQIGEDTSAMVGGAESSSSGAADATQETEKTQAVVDHGSAQGATAGKAKPVPRVTAAGYI